LSSCGGGGSSGGPVAPQITSQPQSLTAVDGQQAQFSVTATGSTPLSYQWLRNGQQIAGAQDTNYIIPAVQYGQSGTKYSVVVYNSAGPTTSSAATLTVTPVPPSITTQPASQSVLAGGSVTFSVVAAGTTPLTYQWNKNGVAIPNAVDPTYVYSGAQLADNNAKITVTVTNVVSSITSSAATLTVTSPGPSIVTEPQSQTVIAGTTATFTVVASGAPPLTFQWIKNGTPISGATGSSYVTPATTLADSGTTFSVTVLNAGGSVPSNLVVLTVVAAGTPPAITAQPQNATATVGGTATFSVTATGSQPLAYQWQVGGNAIPGATDASYTVSPVTSEDNNTSYTVTVSNSVGSITSQAATLSVTVPPSGINLIAGQLGGAGNVNGTGGAARFYGAETVATDAAGNLYVADTYNSTIREITPAGVVTTIAGAPDKTGSTDGVNNNALFNFPQGIATDAAGNIYVADSGNFTIRKITSAGVVSTLAGTVGVAGSADGTGAAAQFGELEGLATDAAGNIYAADAGNSTIRLITPAGVVTTLAGTAGVIGSADGTGAAAQFNTPQGVSVDATGNVYVADSGNDTIRMITPTGVVTTIAGTAGVAGWKDGTGPAAQFDTPQGIAVASNGDIYIADSYTDTIRMMTPAGVVTTIAGGPYVQGDTDGAGPVARFRNPHGIIADAADNLYVADFSNDTIRVITPQLAVSTFAGLAPSPGTANGTQAAAQFNAPTAATADAAGNMYIADTGNDTIRMITPAGVVTTLAGNAGTAGSTDGTGSAAKFNAPQGIAIDGAGNLYVADTANNTIRKIAPGGIVTTLAGTAGTAGAADGTGTAALFNAPLGIALDANNNVYVADSHNDTIRKITPAGVVTTLAGTAGVTGGADGTGAAGTFNTPAGLTIDANGNLFVADSGNYTIREVSPTGQVTTIAGAAGQAGHADGLGVDARFNTPTGITIDTAGNLYVIDSFYRILRQITPAAQVTTVASRGNSRGVILGPLPGSFNSPIGIGILPGTTVNLVVPDKAENSVLQVTLP
jgi:sugar lactone lactonase YvrE